jgi:hypothetical protein
MKSEELTYATAQNFHGHDSYACYYCLATDIHEPELNEFTGGPTNLVVCPRCSIDSVVLKDSKYTFMRLMAMHIEGFHFAASLSKDSNLEPNEPTSCSMGSCHYWNKYLTVLRENSREET